MKPYLSKSRFLKGLQCHKALWLYCYKPELRAEPENPWENGYVESFNGKLRNELLNIEIFDTLFEAKVLTENWRREYNQIRPHSSLGYQPPTPETIEPLQMFN